MDQPVKPPESDGPAWDRVGSIVAEAEAMAQRLRDSTEVRVAQRIQEADRAADLRVAAAEQEAAEILADAQARAEALESEVREATTNERLVTAAQVRDLEDAARREAERVQAEAATEAATQRERARDDARALVGEARDAARAVLREGEQLSANLSEMGQSLRVNAERLLRDVRAAHNQLIATLDRITPAGAGELRARRVRPSERSAEPSGGRDDAGADIDVPEFIPPG
jgi:hypothetical protein